MHLCFEEQNRHVQANIMGPLQAMCGPDDDSAGAWRTLPGESSLKDARGNREA